MERVVNTGNTAQIAVLPDGSKVTLAPESELRFSKSFDESQREVYLEGEAFFNVLRDTARPFLVYTNQVVTKVLGTSFVVKALKEESDITVAVRTGKVSVYTDPDHNVKMADGSKEIILTPNQQVVYNKEENTIARMIVDSPQKIIPEEEVKRMRFEDVPVSEILAAIEKVYGVDIIYDEEVFASCILTTSISDGDLYNRLEAICQAIDATFHTEENTIVVTGSGCGK
jgi:ferric-dicitrate binding protein FerR (iron transport regulator)